MSISSFRKANRASVPVSEMPNSMGSRSFLMSVTVLLLMFRTILSTLCTALRMWSALLDFSDDEAIILIMNLELCFSPIKVRYKCIKVLLKNAFYQNELRKSVQLNEV